MSAAEPADSDRQALDELFSVTYEELRRLAGSVRRDDPGATLSPTALVNEAWLKLADFPAVARTSPLHFKRIAARAMRQVLVDYARRRKAEKRGSGVAAVTLNDGEQGMEVSTDDLLALDEVLDQLEPRQRQVVELRFFGGMEEKDIAEALGISERTVRRDWVKARAWLYRALYPKTPT